MNSAAPLVCPACDIPPRRGLRLKNGERLLRCPRCGLGWWNWPQFDPAGFYDRDYFQSAEATKGYDDYAALEPAARLTARARLRYIRRVRPGPSGTSPGARMIELGCGTGCFLDEARRAGWEARGLEVSEYAARVARARGFPVECAELEDAHRLFGTRSADCVALWDVIEHVRDPRAALLTASALLAPGGLLALSTGDLLSLCARFTGAQWHLFNLPEHLFFFTVESLRRLLQAAGLRLLRVRREVNWIPVRYAIERLRKPLGLRHEAAPDFPKSGWRQALDSAAVPATLLDVIGCYAARDLH